MNNIAETCDTNEFIEIDYSDESALQSKPTVVSIEVPDDVDVDVEGSDSVSDDTDVEGSDSVPDDTDVEDSDYVPDDINVEGSDSVPDDVDIEGSDYVPDDTDAEGSNYVPDGIDVESFDKLNETHDKCNLISKANRKNSKIKQIICEVCFKKFKYLGNLNRHLIHIHGRPRSPKAKVNHTCNVCSKHFKTKFNLRHHLLSHTGDTPFKCNDCGKAFRWRGDRTRHMKTVHKRQKFICNTCKKSYSRLDKLKRHLLIHTGDMPYKCKLCKSTFNRSEALRKHEKDRVATGKCLPLNRRFSRYKKSANKYKCHDCGSYYSKLQYLKIHMRIHTGVKPFQCGTCSKGFIRIDSLRRHVKEKHN